MAPAQDVAWSTLNLASPVVGASSSTLPGGTSYPDLALMVPVRPCYNAGLLTAFMPYNNSSFAADDFLHRYVTDANQLQHDSDSAAVIIDSMLAYTAYQVKGTPMSGIPELRAGATYQGASFLVSNAGALPIAVRDPAYPAKYRPLSATPSGPGGPFPPAAAIFELPYFRTVPVGSLVECARSNPSTAGKVGDIYPALPSTVVPRAGDSAPSPQGGGHTPSATDAPGARPPLLMVAPKSSWGLQRAAAAWTEWNFALHLPSVEPLTWDRMEGFRMDKVARAAILDVAYRRMAAFKATEITDPLIEVVTFKLYRWNAATVSGSWVPVPVPGAAATFAAKDLLLATGPMAAVSTVPIEVKVLGDDGSGTANCKTGSIVLTNPSPSAAPVVLANTLEEGEVYLLEAVLTLKDTAKLMQNFVPPPFSYQLLIEVASAAMPALPDLSTKLSVSPLMNGVDAYQRLEVRLQSDKTSAWKNICRADFLRQSWFWTGRTQPALSTNPDPQIFTKLDLQVGSYPAGNNGALAQWESVEFAERPAADHVELSSTQKSDGFYYTQDLSHDLRATHLRFAPRTFSRYQGMFDGVAGAAWYTQNCVGDATKPDLWKWCLIKSRVRTLVMPRLKALIPLTESAFVPGSPGVMAIFEGPAFDQAGFAEVMTASIAKVSNPDPAGLPASLSQAGPDVLMNSDAPPLGYAPTLLAVGPIGHTLDVDLPGAKYLSHSYIIRPVSPEGAESADAKHDFSWWFANLQFQLKLDPNCSSIQR